LFTVLDIPLFFFAFAFPTFLCFRRCEKVERLSYAF
jgi:hypothetical protein